MAAVDLMQAIEMICQISIDAEAPASDLIAAGSLSTSLAAVGVHTVAMLVSTTTVAILVYEWVGVGILRKSWINLDWLWTGVLIGAPVCRC